MITLEHGLVTARPLLLAQSHRLCALIRDLQAIAEGHKPTETALAEASMLEQWRLGPGLTLRLGSICTGHPMLRGGPIVTSDLWVIDAQSGWARTLSRYYRLGEPASAREAGHG